MTTQSESRSESQTRSEPQARSESQARSERPDGVTVTVTVTDLQELLGADLHAEVVAYTVTRTGCTPADAERQVTECLRYLYLVSRHREELAGLFLPVEQHIDEIWHYLILQTREYRALCEERLPGRFFVHHRGIPYESYQEEPGRRQAAEEALRWIPLYCRAFGPFDEGALAHWTIVRYLHEQMGMSLEEISALSPLASS
ncbi:hypothetical protein ACFC58_23925 [Kitasatospora purpeofusca]|uniref:hypothetical protein n=1 Tax=Kitasatospora purpeofusca TaxID=67352 RepID=UPI0035D8B8FA